MRDLRENICETWNFDRSLSYDTSVSVIIFFGTCCLCLSVEHDRGKFERFARFREKIFVKRGILIDLCREIKKS